MYTSDVDEESGVRIDQESFGDRYAVDVNAERVHSKRGNAMSMQNEDIFDGWASRGEKEEQLLLGHYEMDAYSGSDLDRVTPRYFPNRPRSLGAIKRR